MQCIYLFLLGVRWGQTPIIYFSQIENGGLCCVLLCVIVRYCVLLCVIMCYCVLLCYYCVIMCYCVIIVLLCVIVRYCVLLCAIVLLCVMCDNTVITYLPTYLSLPSLSLPFPSFPSITSPSPSCQLCYSSPKTVLYLRAPPNRIKRL